MTRFNPRGAVGRPGVSALRAAGAVVALGAGQAGAADQAATLPLVAQTVQDRVVVQRTSSNYAPAILRDGATYHLYWCGDLGGDFILHAQAEALDGPWHAASDPRPNSFDVALGPAPSPDRFDARHTCDPSVVKVGSEFLLYYGGAAEDGGLTAIGVASSRDGVRFERLNAGRPIVTPAKTNPAYAKAHLGYGAGQPAAVLVPPYVYLAFTDSTGSGANRVNGAGQFVLRSTDPAFGREVEELADQGWTPRPPGQHAADHSVLESFGLDLAFDRRTGTLVAASDRVPRQVDLFVLDPATFRTRASGHLAMAWREGPALVTEADKATAPRAACDRLPLDVLAAESPSPSPWDWHWIARSSAEVSMAPFCPGPG